MTYKETCVTVGHVGEMLTRIVVGVIFIIAGYGKLFGAPGIDGFSGMLSGLGFPIPVVFAVLVGIIELVGGLLLVAGYWSEWAARLLAIIMIVAILAVHLPNGWVGTQGSEGVRYPLLLLVVLISYIGKDFSWKNCALLKKKN